MSRTECGWKLCSVLPFVLLLLLEAVGFHGKDSSSWVQRCWDLLELQAEMNSCQHVCKPPARSALGGNTPCHGPVSSCLWWTTLLLSLGLGFLTWGIPCGGLGTTMSRSSFDSVHNPYLPHSTRHCDGYGGGLHFFSFFPFFFSLHLKPRDSELWVSLKRYSTLYFSAKAGRYFFMTVWNAEKMRWILFHFFILIKAFVGTTAA